MTASFFVSPTGNNSNDGLSWATAFQTIPYAVSQCPGSLLSSITLRAGTDASPNTYVGAFTIARQFINISNENAGDPQSVIIQPATPGDIVVVDDHSELSLVGVTMDYNGQSGSNGIYVLQHSLADLKNIWVNAFPQGSTFAAQDYGQYNFSGTITVNGGAAALISLNGLCKVNANANFLFNRAGMSFGEVVSASQLSWGDFSATLFSGPGGNVATSGQQWNLANSGLSLPSTYPYPIPGNVAGNGTVTGSRVWAD